MNEVYTVGYILHVVSHIRTSSASQITVSRMSNYIAHFVLFVPL